MKFHSGYVVTFSVTVFFNLALKTVLESSVQLLSHKPPLLGPRFSLNDVTSMKVLTQPRA